MKNILLLIGTTFIFIHVSAQTIKGSDTAKVIWISPVIYGTSKPDTSTTEDPNEVYMSVERDPMFPGGEKKLKLFIDKKLKSFYKTDTMSVKGRVIITFVVEKDGRLTNMVVLRSPNRAYSDEALRLIHKSPKWEPGLIRNLPVRTQYNLPINFTNSEK